MKGIENINRRIGEQVQAEIDGILSRAGEEAAAVTARWQDQVDRETAERKTKNERAAAEHEERLVSVAQMESRMGLLAAKQEMVEKAFSLALDKLCTMPDEQYIAVAAELLTRAAADGHGAAIFAPADRERVGAAAVAEANRRLGEKGMLTLAEETRNIRGGFILSNGNIEVNCTFETLVRLNKGTMSGEVAKLLFPEG